MKIKYFKSIDDALGGPLIEVRKCEDGRYVLSLMIDDDVSYLDGPYPTSEIAECEGIAIAERRGLPVLNVVKSAE